MFSNTTAVGRMTKDPVFRSYQNGGGELATFTVAINNSKDKTDYYDCVAFGKTAELIKSYLSQGKGQMVGIEGYFQTNNTEREVNGVKVTNYGMNLVVNRIHFLSPPQTGQQSPQQAAQPAAQHRPQQPQQPQQGGFTGYGQQAQAQPRQDPFPQQPGGNFGGFGGFNGNISDDDLPF